MRIADALQAVWSRRMLVCLTTGFASGMPLYVLTQLVPAWLTDVGIDLKTVGALTMVSLPYTWKFLWAPLVDRYPLTRLGRRRSWVVATQLVLVAALAGLAAVDPREQLVGVTVVTALIAISSATQDVAADALRRELLADAELGLGNALFVNAYRASTLVPGSLALILADRLPWATVHLVVAGAMALALLSSALIPEPTPPPAPPRALRTALVEPWRAFVHSHGARQTALLAVFLLLYKLGDAMAITLATPFYLEVGFSKTTIGTVAQFASLWASVVGGIAGGAAMLWLGIHRALWVFGVVQLVSILGYAALAEVGPDPRWLLAVVSFEYVGVGLSTTAFVAFIASRTDPRYTASQLALMTSLTGLPRLIASGGSGWLVEQVGWTSYFLLCTAIAVPGMLLLPWVAPWREPSPPEDVVPR